MHDGLFYYPDYSEFMESDYSGDSTTCYLQVRNFVENHRKVVIHRDIKEVVESLHGIFGDVDLTFLDEAQQGLKNEHGALHVDFNDIDERIEEIWRYCINAEFPVARYMKMKDQILNNDYMIEEVRKCLSRTNSLI